VIRNTFKKFIKVDPRTVESRNPARNGTHFEALDKRNFALFEAAIARILLELAYPFALSAKGVGRSSAETRNSPFSATILLSAKQLHRR